MSMDDTDKWASGIINELFEEDVPCDGNIKDAEVVDNKENNENEDSESTPYKYLIANEYESSNDDINGLMSRNTEKSDAPILSPDKFINTSDGTFEKLPKEYNASDSCKNQNHSVIINTHDITPISKISEYESEKVPITIKLLGNTTEIGTFRYINNALTAIQDILLESSIENKDNLSTEKLQSANIDANSSNSFASSVVSENSDVTEKEIENELDELLSHILKIKQYYDEKKLKKERTGKNHAVFRGSERQNIEPKELTHSSLTDLSSKNHTGNSPSKGIKSHLDDSDSTFKARLVVSIQKPEYEVFNNLKNLDVETRDVSMDGDKKVEIKETATKIDEDRGTCNLKENNIHKLEVEDAAQNIHAEGTGTCNSKENDIHKLELEDATYMHQNIHAEDTGTCDSKENNIHKLEVEDAGQNIHAEDTGACNQHSTKDTKERNNLNEDIYFKERTENSVEEYLRGFDSCYETIRGIILERNILRNLVTKNIMERCRICPVADTNIEIINNGSETKDFFAIENDGSPYSTQGRRNILVDEVVHERTMKILTVYRNACETVEALFVRPFAILTAESADLLFFLFYLSICILYILYEKVIENLPRRPSGSKEKRFVGVPRRAMDLGLDESFNLFADTDCVPNESNVKYADSFSTSENGVENSNQPYESGSLLSVNSTNVLILDSIFEMVDLHFKNRYPKCESFEICEEKRVVAEVKLHQNPVVDIVTKVCEGNTEDIEDTREESEFDLEIIASSLKSECKLNKSMHNDISRISPKFSKSLQKLSLEFGKDLELKLPILFKSKNPDVKMLSDIYESDERLFLNSTEIEDSEFVTRSKSRSCNDFKRLSTSDRTIPEVSTRSVCSRVSKDHIVSNSSMNVNLPSFSSRSDMDFQTSDPQLCLSNSLSSLNKIENASFEKWCSTPFKKGQIAKELEKEYGERKELIIVLSSCSSESSENEEMSEPRPSTAQEFEETTAELPVISSKSISPNLSDTFQNSSKYFDDSSNSSSAGDSYQNISDITTDTSLHCKNAEFLPKPSNSTAGTESELLVEGKKIPEGDKKSQNRKSSGGLRRRMSMILNNWKNMQVMHCVGGTNIKKKYKKHVEST